MTVREIQERLRAESATRSPVELAYLVKELNGELTQSSLIMFFKGAFPRIPLKVLIELGDWNGVSTGSIDDDTFNARLQPWCGNREGES